MSSANDLDDKVEAERLDERGSDCRGRADLIFPHGQSS